MADAFTVSLRDLEGMSELLTDQETHFTQLAGYAARTCSAGAGMTNLMSVLVPKIEQLVDWTGWRMRRCAQLLNQTVADLDRARDLYDRTDVQSARQLAGLFDYPMVGRGAYSEFTTQWASVLPGTYTETWADPSYPSGSDPGISDLIEDRRWRLIGKCEEYWAVFTTDEQTLVQKLITPIVGDYARLYWLYEAYRNLGNSTYNITANIRRGTFQIAPRWNGSGGQAFEWYMFCWHQGIGGLGDLLQICSLTFRWGDRRGGLGLIGSGTHALLRRGRRDALRAYRGAGSHGCASH